jgi:hypothetical protein
MSDREPEAVKRAAKFLTTHFGPHRGLNGDWCVRAWLIGTLMGTTNTEVWILEQEEDDCFCVTLRTEDPDGSHDHIWSAGDVSPTNWSNFEAMTNVARAMVKPNVRPIPKLTYKDACQRASIQVYDGVVKYYGDAAMIVESGTLTNADGTVEFFTTIRGHEFPLAHLQAVEEIICKVIDEIAPYTKDGHINIDPSRVRQHADGDGNPAMTVLIPTNEASEKY